MNEMEKRISEIGVVPVIKLNHPERDAAPLANALIAGGVPVAEVTFRAAGAAIAIKTMREQFPEMLVGAGTVLTTAQVDEAMAVGRAVHRHPGHGPRARRILPEGRYPDLPRLHHTPPITTPPTSSAFRCSSSSRPSSPAAWRRSNP